MFDFLDLRLSRLSADLKDTIKYGKSSSQMVKRKDLWITSVLAGIKRENKDIMTRKAGTVRL